MKTQIEKLSPWVRSDNRDEDGDEIILGRQTFMGFETLEAIYQTTEYEHPNVGIIPVAIKTLHMGGTAEDPGRHAVRTLQVQMPGLCGHYRCGAAVEVSLN